MKSIKQNNVKKILKEDYYLLFRTLPTTAVLFSYNSDVWNFDTFKDNFGMNLNLIISQRHKLFEGELSLVGWILINHSSSNISQKFLFLTRYFQNSPMFWACIG